MGEGGGSRRQRRDGVDRAKPIFVMLQGAMAQREAAPLGAEKQIRAPCGVVVVYSPTDLYASRHEKDTRTELARRLARLKGFEFAGEYSPAARFRGSVYFLPSDTLVGTEAAHALGIRGEHDLFGGVVPHPFVATKLITHPLVDPDACAPSGWSCAFGDRVRDVVHPGFSVFTPDDVRQAGARLLRHGPVRIKPVRETGGRGQAVVSTSAELDAALDAMDATVLSSDGLVLEQELSDAATYSVGQVRVAELVATYCGTQRLTRDNGGAVVYGGSELLVARGDFDMLLGLRLSEEAQLAVAQARTYDAAAAECFPGLFASRRNYDIAAGADTGGQRRCGVLEQSWRMGGASGAEVAALEAFRAEPAIPAVRASTVELYGESEAPPPDATVYFRGVDDRIGFVTKYARAAPYGDPR